MHQKSDLLYYCLPKLRLERDVNCVCISLSSNPSVISELEELGKVSFSLSQNTQATVEGGMWPQSDIMRVLGSTIGSISPKSEIFENCLDSKFTR